jgi:hypothetical protein
VHHDMQSCENLATKRPESPAQHTYLFVSDADPRLSNMISRTGNDFTYRFPFIALAVAELPARPCMINGEARGRRKRACSVRADLPKRTIRVRQLWAATIASTTWNAMR